MGQGEGPVRDRGLKRAVGAGGLFTTGYGDVGSSIYYALGVTTLYAMGAAPLAIIIAGVFFVFTALTYAECASMIPDAGGSSSFARHAFNDLFSFVAGWALMLDYVVTIAISILPAASYMGYFFPIFKAWPYNSLFAIALLLFLGALNIIGIRETTRFNAVLIAVDILTQVILIIMGAFLLFSPNVLLSQVHLGSDPTWRNFLYGISIAMIAYIGIESIAQTAEETVDPGKNIPRATMATMVTVLALYIGISLIALSVIPPQELATKWLADPVAGIAHSMPVGRELLAPLVAVLGVTILTVASNAAIIGASRLSFAMGSYHQIPGPLFKVHRRYKTPYLAILLIMVVAIVLVIPGDLRWLADLYNYGAMLAFSMAHLSLIKLRFVQPGMERPFKLHGNVRVKGGEVPVTAVLGFLGTFFVWLIVIATHEVGRVLGTVWMISGLVMYAIYRNMNKLPLVDRAEMPVEEIPKRKPMRIKKVLIPTTGYAHFQGIVETACKVAKADGAMVESLYIQEGPTILKKGPGVPLETGKAAVEKIRRTAMRYGLEVREKVILQGRFAGVEILEELRKGGHDLVVLGFSERSMVDKVLVGDVVNELLNSAPCMVGVGRDRRVGLPRERVETPGPVRIKKILVPTAGYRRADRIMELACKIAKIDGASITALYIQELPLRPTRAIMDFELARGERAFRRVNEIAAMYGTKIETKLSSQGLPVGEEILHEASTGGYDLIMLGVSRRTRVGKLFFGDIVSEIIDRAPCMVYVGRDRMRANRISGWSEQP